MPKDILDDEEVMEPIHYDAYDVEVLDINRDTVAMTELVEDYDDAEELFNKLTVGGGGEIILRELQYSKPNLTGYLKTVIVKTKK